MIRPRVLPIIGVLALAACADLPIEPAAVAPLETRGGASVLAARADGNGTHLLLFKNERIPTDLSTTVERLGGKLLYQHQGIGFALVGNLDAAGAASLSARQDVEAFEADAYTTLDRQRLASPVDPAVNPASAFFYPFQWNMEAVRAPAVWNQGKVGKRSVKVGILDSGIDYLHPEFEGLLDLSLSASFVDDPAVEDGVLPIADYDFHGTHVASMVATNAILTAGVTSNVTLVALKVCDSQGVCPVGASLAGVLDAADKDLDVINMSLGGTLLRSEAKIAPGVNLIRIIEKIFKYASKRGVTVVVAAGNSATDFDADRANYHLYCDVESVICVSATSPTTGMLTNTGFVGLSNEAAAFYTSFGRSVDVAAPGGTVTTEGNVIWVFGVCSGFSPLCGPRLASLGLTIGTSTAAPHVAALAALLAGEIGSDPKRIAARIRNTADDFGLPGRDPLYGHGRINIEKAMERGKHHDRDGRGDRND